MHLYRYASFLGRVAAIVIDTFILGIISAPLYKYANQTLPLWIYGMPFYPLVIKILPGILGFFYFTIFESSKMQGTIGKWIIGIKVTDLKGRRISYWRSILRTLGRIVSAFFVLIGYLMYFFTKKRQTLHDYLSNTVVIKNRPSFFASFYYRFLKEPIRKIRLRKKAKRA